MLEFYPIGDYIYYRWVNVDDDFKMSIKMTVDDERTVVLFPTTQIQRKEIGDVKKYMSFSGDL